MTWRDRTGRVRQARALLAAAGQPGFWRRVTDSRAFDLAVAVVATGVELGLLFDDAHTATIPAILLACVAGVALILRRAAPLPVLAVTLAVTGGLVAIDQSPGGAPVLVALFTVADVGDRRLSLGALVPTAALLLALSVDSVPVSTAAWALGAYTQSRRGYVTGLRARADQLQREREQLARIAVHEERASIARELHDIVAHSVTVMLLGVRGARDALRTRPEVADETLARVETSAEQSLAELRRILALLRDPGQGVESRPQPSLSEPDDLTELVSAHRAAGMPVQLVVVGQRRPLAGGVELSAFRIVQEALTNVLKHAHPTRVTVTLTYRDASLDVEVVDDGAAPAEAPDRETNPEADRTGHGLIGMRERIALLGGELEVGPAPGGFRVAARLPVGADR